MEIHEEEKVVLTTKSKTEKSTVIVIARCIQKVEKNSENNVHVAGGEHRGIVINKTANPEATVTTNPDISLEFVVYLVNSNTGAHTRESRTLRFWFKSTVPVDEHSTIAQQMFKDLVCPNEFPRDYVGFITKILKLIQQPYVTIKMVEIELRKLEEVDDIPKRPNSADESLHEKASKVTAQKLLEIIESSYPNPVFIRDLSIRYSWEEEDIRSYIQELENKNLIAPLEHNHGAYTRVVHGDVDLQIVKQMPTIIGAKQPTIAIITAQYCEKVAIDAFIDNKETYVRYTTVGESNVYTLGNIGNKRVVCTKLPTVGHTREAMIAAGNTTTRLLGTFQKVDHVILLGIGGGVPHFTDYYKHVRLGDVVISHGLNDKKYVYTYCENASYNKENNTYEFETKEYFPTDRILQNIAEELNRKCKEDPNSSWIKPLSHAQDMLNRETGQNFERPPNESDKLYMSIGKGAVIEVSHPVPSDDVDRSSEMSPRIHLGPIASGRAISKNEQLRQAFALQSSALAFDSEFDSVIESVIGSCRESFIIVRGIADYRDGTKRSEWQPFASLSAATVVNNLISSMK